MLKVNLCQFAISHPNLKSISNDTDVEVFIAVYSHLLLFTVKLEVSIS